MPRLKFGAFLAPHHPIGEHPMLQFRRDLDLVEHLDKLGYEEFWCGEHHSSGWEMIGSPEMFLAAAGERSKRIKRRMTPMASSWRSRSSMGSMASVWASDARAPGPEPKMARPPVMWSSCTMRWATLKGW